MVDGSAHPGSIPGTVLQDPTNQQKEQVAHNAYATDTVVQPFGRAECRVRCGRGAGVTAPTIEEAYAAYNARLPIFRNRFHRAVGESLWIEVLGRPWDAEEMDAALLREYRAYVADGITGVIA